MKTLAMMKMEKNFRAVIEKKYPRNPYEVFSYDHLLEWLTDEFGELVEAIKVKKDIEEAKMECADVSNLIDFLFERLCNEEKALI